MPEFLIFILVLLLLLFVWAAIGHLVWLAICFSLKLVFGKKCSRCERRYLSNECHQCRTIQQSFESGSTQNEPSIDADLAAAKRLIGFSRFNRWLSEEQHASLDQLVARMAAKIHQESPATLPQPDGLSAGSSGRTESTRSDKHEAPSAIPQHAPPILEASINLPTEVASPPPVTAEVQLHSGNRIGKGSIEQYVHPLDKPEPLTLADRPRPPLQTRVTASLLKSFMEQSNIRWVELISATLIVVCSVGLVISLWNTLSSTSRFFPSLVFMLATIAVHGAGQYTLRQWKLRTTSRGILHIGLMLIPLAMLVGILLSRRDDGLPSLNSTTALVVIVGAIVYGALAITACQSLFLRRWKIVAAHSVVASLTLLPINYFADSDRLATQAASYALLPLLLVSLWAALTISRSNRRLVGISTGLARRIGGMVTQCMFGGLVALGFWILQSRGASELSNGWWVISGILAVAWASWGWSASLSNWMFTRSASGDRLPSVAHKPSTVSGSWLTIAAWLIASLLSIFLLAALWHLGTDRLSLILLLAASAGWWFLQGWLCQLRISVLAGVVSSLVVATLLVEQGTAESGLMQAVDWLSFSRIATLSLFGFVACSIPALLRIGNASVRIPQAPSRIVNYRTASLTDIYTQVPIGGSIVVAAAALLTIIASQLPIGVTPYGGNWAASLLIAYGIIAISAGVLLTQNIRSNKLLQFVMPLGQGLLLLGVVRLCQTSPMLDSVLADLRPMRAWAAGTAVLAAAWSSTAACLRLFSHQKQLRNINLLAGSSVLLGVVSALAIWTTPDQLRLASWIGWFLPMTMLAIFISWRYSAWRELTLLALNLWLGSLLIMVGLKAHWWTELGLAATSASVILLLTLGTIGFEWWLLHWKMAHLGSPQAVNPTDTAHLAIETEKPSTWFTDGQHWGAQVTLLISWVVLCLTLAAPALVNVSLSLGGSIDKGWIGFGSQTLTSIGFSISLFACLSLVSACVWLTRVRTYTGLMSLIALLPGATALSLAAWLAPPFALAWTLWLLAAWLLASELLQFLGDNWQRRSQSSWQRFVALTDSSPATDQWLTFGRAHSLGLLCLGTTAFILAGARADLPELTTPTANWLTNEVSILRFIGPLLLVGLIRWILSVWNAESPLMQSSAALLVALSVAFTSVLGIKDYLSPNQQNGPMIVIVLLYSASLTNAVLAWSTVAFTALRNFVGLHRMLRGKVSTRELLNKSLKGARWQRAEKASWRLSLYALSPIILLTLGAAVAVIYYPIRALPVLERLGGFGVAIAAIVTFTLFCWLMHRRGSSKFGLLAGILGLMAPLGAAAYANWLMADPNRIFVDAHGFEPYRLIVVLWLLALTIGLSVRVVAAMQSRIFSSWGEAAWILLAVAIGSLAFVSTTQDPNPMWALTELSVLALIVVISGAAARQPWRGHAAAIIAAAALSGWMIRQHSAAPIVHQLWIILWGPTWIAGVALIAQRWFQRCLPEVDSKSTAASFASFGIRVEQSTSLTVPLTTAFLSFLWMAVRSSSPVSNQTELIGQIAALAMASLAISTARLWEPLPAKRGLSVYLNVLAVGLVLATGGCAWWDLPILQSWLIWLASGLSAMAVMAGLLRELTREASLLGAQLRLGSVTTVDKFRHALSWMPVVHTVAAMLALIPCILLVLAFQERALRIAATVLPFIGAIAILPIASERDRSIFRYCGLTLISSSLVLLWWADLPCAWAVADVAESWIFIQRTFVALVSLGCVYPLLAHLLRHKEPWIGPLMQMGWISLGLGVMTGTGMLVGSITKQWDQVAATTDIASKIMTMFAWSGVTARLLQFAARPHSSDQNATTALRKAAVFAAEFGITMFCLATYFHFPHLFSGIFVNWWPIVLFGIAMVSAGIGEWMRRLKQPIIADPVQQSSLLLPIAPLAGVWFFQPETAQLLWNEWGKYAFLLLNAAGLYGVHSWARNSTRLRVVAGSFALFSFWCFLHSYPNMRFFAHPQFWLLPPALATLVFTEFNRRRLDVRAVVATRYIAILVAYLSSTSEIFLKAFEGQLWQPMLLLILALMGVAAGILLRVRAFLLCGAAFTMVALLGMVWHAQQAIGQVWPWWAFGIATGICLIVLLGYFEKNRARVLAYLEQFKNWEQ